MKRLIATALVLAALTACASAQMTDEQWKYHPLRHFYETNYTLSYAQAEIPMSVRATIQIMSGGDPVRMANPGEEFGPTAPYEKIPDKRLVFAGQGGSSYFILYDQATPGGFHRIFLLVTLIGINAAPEWQSFVKDPVANLTDLKELARTGKLNYSTAE